MNQNVKALLARGLLAVEAVSEAKKGIATSLEVVLENPSTKRAAASFFGSITPRGLQAAIVVTESMALVYEEISTKLHILNRAMPDIADALEAACDSENLIPGMELVEAGMELEAEQAAKNTKVPTDLVCDNCKKPDPYLAPELAGARCTHCRAGYMRAPKAAGEDIQHDSVERATTSIMGSN